MGRVPTLLGACLLVAAASASGPAPEPPRVDDFALLDQHGRFHRLSSHAAARAVVLFVQGNGCPIARNSIPVLNALRAEFEPRGAVFLALNASPQDERAAVAAEAAAYGLELPVLLDEAQLVSGSLGVERTAETFVIDPASRRLLYRGPVDDRLHYETQRPARREYLREVLEAQLAGRPLPFERRPSPGCLILFEARPGAGGGPRGSAREAGAPSYARDVAPILMDRCRGCHRDGGVAPWAMTSFAMLRGWSPMLREVILTRRMPPWHADPAVGRFSNDISLRPEEARALVRWVEAGAPRGDGPDPLAEQPAAAPPEWPLGPPDLVLAGERQEVPATGVVPYRYETLDVPLERDVWLRAADVRPSNPAVAHHATAYLVYPSGAPPSQVEGPHFARGLFAGYVPGREPEIFPEDTGFFLPRGTRIRFQLHYDPTGRPEVDVPRIGLYFAHAPRRHALQIGAAANLDFEVPPGASDHEAVAVRALSRDVVVYRLTPHMHYRGKRMAIEAHHADGTRELLLNVPNYSFGWQRQYVLAEPKLLRAGTRIVARAGFDNSAANPANPDPTVSVRWGEQSFEEMLIGYVLYRDAEPGEGS